MQTAPPPRIIEVEIRVASRCRNGRKVEADTVKRGWAVEFYHNGRMYRTITTCYEFEAKGWAASVEAYGWCISGRPVPSDVLVV